MTAATGPNTSSSCAGCPGATSASTVGGYQAPGRSGTRAAEQQAGAGRERSPRPAAWIWSRAATLCSGPSVGRRVARVAHLERAHRLDEAPPRTRPRPLATTMKRLPAMQLWPALTMRAAAQTFAAASRSASSRDDERHRQPPSSSTHFFSARAGGGGDAAAGALAAGQRRPRRRAGPRSAPSTASLGDQQRSGTGRRESRRRGTRPRSRARSRARCWRA